MKIAHTLHLPTKFKVSPGNFLGFYIIQCYVNLAYYSLLFPLRISYEERIQRFRVHTSGMQRLLSILFFVIYIVYVTFCNGYRIFHHRSVREDPSQYFAVTESVIDISYPCVLMYTVFCHLGRFHEFLEKAQRHHPIQPMTNFQKYGISALIFSIFWVYSALVQIWEIGSLQSAVSDGIIDFGIKHSHSKEGVEEDIMILKGKALSPLGRVAETSLHLFFGFGRAMSNSIVVLFFALGLYLKDLCGDVRATIVDGLRKPSEILESYMRIKRINSCINSMFSTLFFLYVVGSVPFFARCLMNLGEQSATIFLRFTHLTFQFLLSMVGSAAANRKAASLRDELILQKSRNRDFDFGEHTTFTALLTELSSTSVGLHGSVFFTATYQFLGMMLSQGLVYAIILLQLQSSLNNP